MKKPINYLGNNIKFLRMRRKRSQDILAQVLNVSRATINSYENGFVASPPINILLRISEYFKISIDTLLRVDLSKLPELELLKIEKGYESLITGVNMRILTTTVDTKDKENITVVPIKAKAGYTTGFADVEFISSLKTFQLPFVEKDRTYRTFQIDGDSMPPLQTKDYVLGTYVENWKDVKDGKPYIVVTKNEGFVFKLVFNQIKEQENLLLKSTNAQYKDYTVVIDDVLEIWKYEYHLSSSFVG